MPSLVSILLALSCSDRIFDAIRVGDVFGDRGLGAPQGKGMIRNARKEPDSAKFEFRFQSEWQKTESEADEEDGRQTTWHFAHMIGSNNRRNGDSLLGRGTLSERMQFLQAGLLSGSQCF